MSESVDPTLDDIFGHWKGRLGVFNPGLIPKDDQPTWNQWRSCDTKWRFVLRWTVTWRKMTEKQVNRNTKEVEQQQVCKQNKITSLTV